MRVGLYARVSTSDKGQDVELQLKDLRVYAQARGWNIHDEYSDIGESGAKDKRPQLNRLLEDVRMRKIDSILVWRLDRFGRSLKHLVNILDELNTLGVAFVSSSENLDFTTSTGQLFFHLLGVLAEFERNLIKERVEAGMADARTKGLKLGRPRVYVKKIGSSVCPHEQTNNLPIEENNAAGMTGFHLYYGWHKHRHMVRILRSDKVIWTCAGYSSPMCPSEVLEICVRRK